MSCLHRCLGFVPGPVQVATVHLGYQSTPKLLSISKAAQAGKVSPNIGDDNGQVCVQVSFWVPTMMLLVCVL